MKNFSTPFPEFEAPFEGDCLDLSVKKIFEDSHRHFSQGLLIIESKGVLVTSGKSPDTNLNFYYIDRNLLITSFGYLSMNHKVCNLKYSEEHEVILGITLSSYLYIISMVNSKPKTIKTIEKIAKFDCLMMFSMEGFFASDSKFNVRKSLCSNQLAVAGPGSTSKPGDQERVCHGKEGLSQSRCLY